MIRTMGMMLLAGAAAIASAQFTPGKLVVAQIGDGAPVPSATNVPVVLRELNLDGTFTGYSVSLTAVGGRNNTVAYGETSEANLYRTPDKQFLMIGGFDLSPRDGSWDRIGTPRVAVRVPASGTPAFSAGWVPASSLEFPPLGDGARMVLSIDGDTFWATGGDQGIVKGTFAGPIQQFLAPFASSRTIMPYGSTFIFNGSNVVGGENGFVEWDGVSNTSVTELFPTPAGGSSRDFHIIDADTMYVAASSSGVGLVKMKRTGGVWAEEYRLSGAGLSSIVVADGKIFATASGGGNIRWTQDTGMAFTPWTIIATAATDFRFRGIELAPEVASANAVTGTVDFGQLTAAYNTGANLPTSIPVSFRDGGNSEIATGSATYNPVTGAFSASVPGSVTVPYRVSFKLGFWLRKTMPNPADPAAPLGNYNFGTVTPLVGDSDDDNEVTNFDYSLWAAANGNSVTANTDNDFDGDGEITNFDYSLWAANNGALGDN
ncbi:MAG TPA: hypothetical protein PLO61_09990 [Fimbriimonadaceae bacterium]|nr:hypothetical protein [Fimbriimonadaceae bacterium]HRJ33965.1 hypothetical protein [Fimbriimonadaceae bacterium]